MLSRTIPPVLEPPPVVDDAGMGATMLAAVHPYGHEEPQGVSRDGFEVTVRAASYVKEDALEVFPAEQMVEGMYRELDLMHGVPVHKAVPRAEATSKIRSIRWCHRRKGPGVVRIVA